MQAFHVLSCLSFMTQTFHNPPQLLLATNFLEKDNGPKKYTQNSPIQLLAGNIHPFSSACILFSIAPSGSLAFLGLHLAFVPTCPDAS